MRKVSDQFVCALFAKNIAISKTIKIKVIKDVSYFLLSELVVTIITKISLIAACFRFSAAYFFKRLKVVPWLRVVQTQAILLLKSMSERVGSDIERF